MLLGEPRNPVKSRKLSDFCSKHELLPDFSPACFVAWLTLATSVSFVIWTGKPSPQFPSFFRSRLPPLITLIKQLIETIFFTPQMRGNSQIVVTSEGNVRNWSGLRCPCIEKDPENENGHGLFTSLSEKVITVSSTNLFRSRSWRVNWCVLYLHRCALVCNGVWITIIEMNRCAQVFWSGFFIQVVNAITSLQPLERIRNFGPLSYLNLDDARRVSKLN